MRRSAFIPVVVLATGLAACGSFRDLFSAHADVVAEAGDQRLTPQRLSQIMAGGKGMRANRDAAGFVTNTWVDYSLFAQAVAAGKLPLDSASIAQAVWPELAELRAAPTFPPLQPTVPIRQIRSGCFSTSSSGRCRTPRPRCAMPLGRRQKTHS